MKTKEKPFKAISTPISFNRWLPFALVAITAIVYYNSLNNEFTNWDDNVNITENANIRTLHGDSVGYTLKKAFSINTEMGMYAPIQELAYSMEFEEYQLDPHLYHLTNLVFHIINALLVFAFAWLLCRQQWVAFITSLLFAIHPMHTESVAWITGQIDTLYSLFYLAALCTYIWYTKAQTRKWQLYALTL